MGLSNCCAYLEAEILHESCFEFKVSFESGPREHIKSNFVGSGGM